MSNNEEPKPRIVEDGFLGFLKDVGASLLGALVKFILAFVVGTGGGAIVCWYYGLPLALSIVGGILVLGLALALSTDSLFS